MSTSPIDTEYLRGVQEDIIAIERRSSQVTREPGFHLSEATRKRFPPQPHPASRNPVDVCEQLGWLGDVEPEWVRRMRDYMDEGILSLPPDQLVEQPIDLGSLLFGLFDAGIEYEPTVWSPTAILPYGYDWRVGDYRYFLTPPALLENCEIPDGWGVLELHAKEVRVAARS